MAEAEPSLLVDIEDVAKMTKHSVHTVRYWRQIGYGPRFGKFGRMVMARRADVEAWIADQIEAG